MKSTIIAVSTLAALPYASATFGGSASANLDFGAIPSCAKNCVSQSFDLAKCALTDFKCLCSNQKFIETVNSCLAGPCGAGDKTKALTLAYNFCNSIGIRLPDIGLNLNLPNVGLGLNGGLGLNLGGGLGGLLGGGIGGSAGAGANAGAGKSGYGNGYGAASGSGNAGNGKNGNGDGSGSGSVSAGLALADQTPATTVNAVPATETPAASTADVNIQNSAAETPASLTININTVASAATDVVSSVSAATDVLAAPATVTVTVTAPCSAPAAATPLPDFSGSLTVSVLVASESATLDIASTAFSVETPTATASMGFVATPAGNETFGTPTTPAMFTGAASAIKGSVAMAVAAGFVAALV